MKKKIWIFLIILVLLAGGFFYWWSNRQSEEEESQPPTLFSKEDYKIQERADGKYIVVEKVGLTAKVPEGWRVEKEGSDIPEPEYWINLYSPDAEVKEILTKGCSIGVMLATATETVQRIEENIKLLQEHPEKSSELKDDYFLADKFDIIEISDYSALKVISQEHQIMGQGINVDIPIGSNVWINFNTVFPSGYKEKCSPIWEDFLKTVVIK